MKYNLKNRMLNLLTILLMGSSLFFFPLSADQESGSRLGQCSCGCKCGSDCNCGCKTGKPCTCIQKKADQQCSCGCACGVDCQCGCQSGAGCECAQSEELFNEEGAVFGLESCNRKKDFICGANCCYSEQEINESQTLAMYEPCCGYDGTWMPDDPVLFRPFVADPRQITYSAGWRFNDKVFTQNVIDVSFGDTFPFYRWCSVNIGPYCGALQIDLEGALWAIFDPLHDSSPLLNADYYVGIPITFAFDRWGFRLRAYHISSHIGDEFLLDHPGFHRRNASAEYVDFFISHDLTDEIRVYSGLGYIVAQDKEFRCKRFYAEAGAELRLPKLGFLSCKDQLYGLPFYGMHLRARGNNRRHMDMTYVLGYEFGKLCGIRRRMRIFAEYHDGYSVEGQFCKLATHYFSLRMSYGF